MILKIYEKKFIYVYLLYIFNDFPIRKSYNFKKLIDFYKNLANNSLEKKKQLKLQLKNFVENLYDKFSVSYINL